MKHTQEEQLSDIFDHLLDGAYTQQEPLVGLSFYDDRTEACVCYKETTGTIRLLSNDTDTGGNIISLWSFAFYTEVEHIVWQTT
jgi:hypothetical protein